MSLSAAVIDALLSSGATREQIAAAIKADIAEREAEAAAKIEAKREGNRERQRRYREAHCNDDNALQPLHDVSNSYGPSPQSPPLKSTPDPEKITPPLTPQPIVGGARPKFAAPDGVSADQWKAFRQQRKKSLNDHSYKLLCNKLNELADAGWPPGEMIDLAIERGWETVFEPKDKANGGAHRGSSRRMGGPRPDPTLELVRAATEAQREERRDHGEARFALPSR